MTDSEIELSIADIQSTYQTYKAKVHYERSANQTNFTLRFVLRNVGYITQFSLPFGKENILKRAVNKSILSVFAKELGTTL